MEPHKKADLASLYFAPNFFSMAALMTRWDGTVFKVFSGFSATHPLKVCLLDLGWDAPIAECRFYPQ